MNPRSISLLAALLFPLAAAASGCSKGNTVGETFQNLGGSGGNSTGGSAGMGAGGASTTGMGAAGGASTASDTTSSAGGGAGMGGGGSGGGSGGGPTCMDTAEEKEPNDTEAQARDLGTIGDNDGEGSSIKGALNGPNDIDWFKYHGVDNFGSSVDPTRSVTFASGARICKYAQCENNSDPGVSCPQGTTADTSFDGRKGCCGVKGFTMGIDCSGIDDNATIYVRLDSPSGGDCNPYTLNYHY